MNIPRATNKALESSCSLVIGNVFDSSPGNRKVSSPPGPLILTVCVVEYLSTVGPSVPAFQSVRQTIRYPSRMIQTIVGMALAICVTAVSFARHSV